MTSLFRTVVLTITLGIGVSSTSGQDSPQSLGAAFLKTVAAGDRAALKNLIHSASLAEVAPERIDRVVNGWLAFKVDSSWTVRIVPTDSMRGYDAANRSYTMGPIRVSFPVAPEQFLMVERQQQTGDVLRSEGTADAITRDGGAWKIVIGSVGRRP